MASTELDATMPVTEPVRLEGAWMLSPSVALRPESFGALAYHFGNRKLTFLKRPELVRVVQALGEQADVRTALETAGVPPRQQAAYLAALEDLAAADMIQQRNGATRETTA